MTDSQSSSRSVLSYLVIGAGILIAFGASQTQIQINSNRLTRLENEGSPQLREMRTGLEEISRRLERQDAAMEKRLDLLETDVSRLGRNAELIHGAQTEHLHAIDQRLDRDEAMMRTMTSDTLQLINDKLVSINAKIGDVEVSGRATAKDVITTVADRISSIDKRLALVEQTTADIRTRIDGYTKQQDLMLRDMAKDLAR